MVPPQNNKPKSRLRERKKRRRLGSRAYKNYSNEMLELACESVANNKISSRDAERQFGIPRRTILNKIQKKHIKTIGRPTALTAAEEKSIVRVLIASSDFGYPLTKLDLKLVVSEYLKKNSRGHLFKNQIPGDAWVQSFLERHVNELSLRTTQNITKARSEKGAEEIADYFENLSSTLENIRAENIINFDETNLSDDPGCSRGIFRRGIKYPERVANSSKGNISLMFTATANGRTLPWYVVYKASNLYSEWISGGPPETRFNCSKSGWFDSAIFEDYFEKIIIPWAQETPETKVVICDNLSSHLSVKVVEFCDQNNIKLVFIPPRTTHLTQPLDVAFFAPLKKAWRQILFDYKLKNPNQTSINKKHFPKLLVELAEAIKYNEEKNIKSGFRASGIFPFNPQEVLKKLPEMQEEILSYSVDQVLIDYLKEMRAPKPLAVKRNKKVNCEPGTSITISDFNATSVKRNLQANTKKISVKKAIPKSTKTKKNKEHRGDMTLDEQTGLFTNTASKSRSSSDTPEKYLVEDIEDNFENVTVNGINSISVDDFIITGTTERTNEFVIPQRPESLGFKCINMINSLMGHNIAPVQEYHRLVHASTSGNIDVSLTKTDNDVSPSSASYKINILSNEVIKVGSSKSDVLFLNSASKKIENISFIAIGDEDIPECLRVTEPKKLKQMKAENINKKWKYINVKEKLQLGCKQKKPNKNQVKIKKDIRLDQPSNISFDVMPNVDFPKNLLNKNSTKKVKTNAPERKKKNCINITVKNNKKVLRKRMKRFDSSSSTTSTDSASQLIIADSDNSEYETLNDCLIAECLRDQEDKENFESNEIAFGVQDIEYFDEDNNKLKESDWVIVRFSTKKSIKHFVGKVLSVKNNIPTLKFTRKVKETKCEKGTTFTYPKVDDICTIPHSEDILTVLPAPNVTRRGQFIFNADFKNLTYNNSFAPIY